LWAPKAPSLKNSEIVSQILVYRHNKMAQLTTTTSKYSQAFLLDKFKDSASVPTDLSYVFPLSQVLPQEKSTEFELTLEVYPKSSIDFVDVYLNIGRTSENKDTKNQLGLRLGLSILKSNGHKSATRCKCLR